MSAVRALERAMSLASSGAALLGAALMLVMMVQVTLDVILKYLLNFPIPTTLELVASYYMAALIFLPLGLVTRDGEHLEVELFTRKLAPRPLAAFRFAGCLVGVAYMIVMLKSSIGRAIKMTAQGEQWESATFHIDVWPARWFLPVGAALMLVWLVLQTVHHLSHWLADRPLLSPRPAADPAHPAVD